MQLSRDVDKSSWKMLRHVTLTLLITIIIIIKRIDSKFGLQIYITFYLVAKEQRWIHELWHVQRTQHKKT